jgi:hypothetical protein
MKEDVKRTVLENIIKNWENDNNIPFSKLNSKNTPNEK